MPKTQREWVDLLKFLGGVLLLGIGLVFLCYVLPIVFILFTGLGPR